MMIQIEPKLKVVWSFFFLLKKHTYIHVHKYIKKKTVKLYSEPWVKSCAHGLWAWMRQSGRESGVGSPFSWHEYGQDSYCFHYSSEDGLIVHPWNAPAPPHTGLHFHSLCISTRRATSGQRNIQGRDIPYSRSASLTVPSSHEQNSRLDLRGNLWKSGMPGPPPVTSLSASISVHISSADKMQSLGTERGPIRLQQAAFTSQVRVVSTAV